MTRSRVPPGNHAPRAHGLAAFFQHLAARPRLARRPDGANGMKQRAFGAGKSDWPCTGYRLSHNGLADAS